MVYGKIYGTIEFCIFMKDYNLIQVGNITHYNIKNLLNH